MTVGLTNLTVDMRVSQTLGPPGPGFNTVPVFVHYAQNENILALALSSVSRPQLRSIAFNVASHNADQS